MFRIILWIFIILVCLIPVSYIGIAVLRAPSKDQYQTAKSYIDLSKQYVNNEDIDMNLVVGDSENTEYVRIFAQYLADQLKINRELSRQKNFLVILIRPPNLIATQALDVSLEKVDEYEKTINELHNQREQDLQNIIDRMNGLDKKKVTIFDIVSFNQAMNAGKAEREKEIQQYLGLSQYIKALLQFCKTRVGYYQLIGEDKVQFSRPEDQAYYEKLVSGINQYIKLIDDMVSQHNSEDRKQLSGLTH